MPKLIARLEHVLRVERQPFVLFKGSFTSDLAKKIVQVHVFQESKSNHVTEQVEIGGNEGYQRPAYIGRQNKFAHYLEASSKHGVFAPPVILNARGLWRFASRGGSAYGKLSLHGRANIIDGQHRLGGYIAHYEKGDGVRDIDFVAYEKLDLEEEKRVFHTINTNQKGVHGALSVVLNVDGTWQNRIARKVAEEASSPFAGKVSMTGLAGAKYLWKLNAVAKNLERMFASGAFEGTAEESKYDIFVAYWKMVRDSHQEAWEDFGRPPRQRKHKLLELTGLIAYSRLFGSRLAQYYRSTTDTVDWDAVSRDLEAVAADVDLAKDGCFKGMTGEYGGGQILREMEKVLARQV